MRVGYSVANPHHVDADLDPACHNDADPDPTFHFNADLDPDLSLPNKVSKPLRSAQIGSYFIYILACHMQTDADPDPA